MSRAATMPTTPGCQPSPAAQTSGPSAPRRRLRLGRRPHRRLDLAPLGVEAVEAGGQRRRLVRVVGGEEPRAEVGDPDPPAGVHPRPEHEAEAVGRGRSGHPRRRRQRRDARPLAARHHGEALAHQRPVEAGERRHVRHGGERDEVEEGEEVRALGALGAHQAVDRDKQEEDHGGGAEVAEGAVLVLAVGVHHG